MFFRVKNNYSFQHLSVASSHTGRLKQYVKFNPLYASRKQN